MQTDYQWANSSYDTKMLGGYWRPRIYTGYAFNKEFTLANTDAAAMAPANTLLAIAYANGTPKDVVANMSVAIANANNSSLFGFNAIATSTGRKRAIFRGGEIDVEPGLTDTALPGSAGLYINVFNKNIQGPAIQTGGHAGTFANGLMCDGISTSGSCLGAVGGSAPMGSLVNASNGTYSGGAFITGTGIGQGFGWGTGGGGVSPYTYGDSSNNFLVQLGQAGVFAVKNSAGSTTEFQVTPSGTAILASLKVAALPPCNAGSAGSIAYVTDANAPTYNGALTGGGAARTLALCNGAAWTAH